MRAAWCVFVETDEKTGFEVTAAMIEKHITPKTKLVVINSPCNPSGGVLSREEFRAIFDVTSKHGVFLMTDECYCQFLYEDKPFSIAALPGAKETVVVAGSLSKTYAMTGWRIRLRAGSYTHHRSDDETAEPQHFEPYIHCAEGGGGSGSRLTGIGTRDDWLNIGPGAISSSSGCVRFRGSPSSCRRAPSMRIRMSAWLTSRGESRTRSNLRMPC